MKKWLIGIVLAGVLGKTAIFAIKHYQRNQLRKPTPIQIQKAFPGNTRDIFEHSDKFILLSLAGMEASLQSPFELVSSRLASDSNPLPTLMFHNYRVQGQTEIKDKNVQERIRAIYDDGISDTHFSAACFSPKHGIRTVRNGQTLDIVICFHCAQVNVYLNNNEVAWSHFGSIHQPEFDAILTNADVPLPLKSTS
jgi:hypothetical protein